MPESSYGVVEMLFSFGAVVAFCLWQLRSVEKTRKRLKAEQAREDQARKEEARKDEAD